jgi:hypothetical protein
MEELYKYKGGSHLYAMSAKEINDYIDGGLD